MGEKKGKGYGGLHKKQPTSTPLISYINFSKEHLFFLIIDTNYSFSVSI
jgi:hypothetical protein